jgi:hypothetical protein
MRAREPITPERFKARPRHSQKRPAWRSPEAALYWKLREAYRVAHEYLDSARTCEPEDRAGMLELVAIERDRIAMLRGVKRSHFDYLKARA